MATVEYIELFWDCPECGQSHISAVFNSHGNRCPSCWYWCTEEDALYESPDSQIITDPALIHRKPFWVCKICDAVNEDTGLSPHLLQCGSCNSYQTSQVGEITGNEAADQKAPDAVAVGESVEFRKGASASDSQASAQTSQDNQKPKSLIRRLTVCLIWINLIGGGVLASLVISSYLSNRSLLQVQVTDLEWIAEVDVEEQKTITRQAWEGELPSGASVIKSERRQRGTRQEQQGFQTVMVPERYQSSTRTETYTEPERYQSGTRNETYMESERYQSGTRQDCRTVSRGNGVGTRSCHSAPVYSTRQVQRTRTVPVYSTRPVQRTRTVPVYSTRMVPRQEPIMVDVPVYGNFLTYQVEEWVFQQTHSQTGKDDALRRPPDVKLAQQPPQRISATRTVCRLSGNYSSKVGWFQPPEPASETWQLPCQEYDRIDIGDWVQLREESVNSANLVQLVSP